MNPFTSANFLVGKSQLSIFLIWLVTLSGTIGIWLGYGDWFFPKTPFNLLLGVVLLYWNFPLKNGGKSLLVWTSVYLLGMGTEIVGVNTGQLFGDYSYGNNMGLKVFGVPLLIGINWVVLTFLTATISRRLILNKWAATLVGALLMVGLDFFIEPVAPIFDFWKWDAGYAPLRNFVDWFFISLFMQMLVMNDRPKKKHALPIHPSMSLVLFFTLFYVK